MDNKIRFSCRKCGKCCKLGFIYLKPGETGKIAAFLGVPEKEFKKKHTVFLPFLGRMFRWDESGGCKFLKNNQCSIYPARPSQCSTWPYWDRLKRSRMELERAKEYCKGIE